MEIYGNAPIESRTSGVCLARGGIESAQFPSKQGAPYPRSDMEHHSHNSMYFHEFHQHNANKYQTGGPGWNYSQFPPNGGRRNNFYPDAPDHGVSCAYEEEQRWKDFGDVGHHHHHVEVGQYEEQPVNLALGQRPFPGQYTKRCSSSVGKSDSQSSESSQEDNWKTRTIPFDSVSDHANKKLPSCSLSRDDAMSKDMTHFISQSVGRKILEGSEEYEACSVGGQSDPTRFTEGEGRESNSGGVQFAWMKVTKSHHSEWKAQWEKGKANANSGTSTNLSFVTWFNAYSIKSLNEAQIIAL